MQIYTQYIHIYTPTHIYALCCTELVSFGLLELSLSETTQAWLFKTLSLLFSPTLRESSLSLSL